MLFIFPFVKIWTPIGQRGNVGRPETWLKGVKDVEPSQRLLFDPGDIVESMQSLRRSSLAKYIFGEKEDFQLSDEDFSPANDGADYAYEDDVKTTIQRKRKSSEVDKDTGSVSVKFSKRHKKIRDSLSQGNKGNKLPIAAAPQKHLPFNSKDLQLVRAKEFHRFFSTFRSQLLLLFRELRLTGREEIVIH